jgi:hypothetical protein
MRPGKICLLRKEHEPEALHPRRYRGPAGGRFAAVAHVRLAAQRYYATRWLAEEPSAIMH